MIAENLYARSDQDLRQIIQNRIQRLDGAITRCQQRIASGEIDECDVKIDWQNTTVSLDAARTIESKLRAGLKTFVVTTKSFIHHIDTSSLSGDVRTRAEKLFGQFSNLQFSENPATPSVNAGDFRLFSRVAVTVLCQDDEITNWQFGELETEFGSELGVLGADGKVDEPLSASPDLGDDDETDEVDFSYGITGRPNATTLPSFLAVHNRSCSWIWHKVRGSITCSGNTASIDVNVTGSKFPSVRTWINGQQQPTIYQGPFSTLWDCDPSDPRRVQ